MSSTNKVFGQTMKPKVFSAKKKLNSNFHDESFAKSSKKRFQDTEKDDHQQDDEKIDEIFGFERMKYEKPRLGWLLNYLPATMYDERGMKRSGLDLYFIDREGGNFKASLYYEPYFYVDACDPARIMEISQHLSKRLEGCRVEIVHKEDLDMANHLSGKKHQFLKLSFGEVSDLVAAKSLLRPIIAENQKNQANNDYSDLPSHSDGASSRRVNVREAQSDPLTYLIDMREYDVPYSMRAAIDLDLRVGAWHIVTPDSTLTTCQVTYQKDMLELCEPKVLAFDIECEKSPLKFPNAERDRIFMISYMTPGQGYLLINREVVSEDIADFEYTPMPKYPGPFIVINLADEEALLRKFISHIQELKPHVIVTYNGDFFDWPYVEARCSKYEGLNLYKNLGMKCVKGEGNNSTVSSSAATGGEYVGRCMVHLDAFSWVQRDSYLPQGNQGLKAVTKYKLGYDPVEVDPEDMVAFAKEKPEYMASYSVSDAVATYYLYQTFVHNFIFSLCTIIPMPAEDVLRKGSGTLCEALLMVEAFKGNIICPNKQNDPIESFTLSGHLLESETYIGGHVECLEAGVFRSDIPVKFNLVPSALSHLIERIDQDLAFACEVEHGIQRHEVMNYDEVRQSIIEKLEMLRDRPNREEVPMIYHLDVGAMYPNIILTNRLQPSAIVSHRDCASCDFNRTENNCKREMTWTWRGEYNPVSSAEYASIRRQLSYEKLGDRTFAEYSEKEQAQLVKDRLKKYAHRVYKKTKVTSTEERVNTVCQRENAFYVNTVRAFRDRRYDYKLLTKTWKNKKNEAEKTGNAIMRKAAEEKEILMDSLQLAHKCILNSFYGYVMRKGARWRSMEMAGIVTHTGAQLIKQARELIEQVGRPLELDTDGIWCVLPASFPQDFQIRTIHGKSFHVGYPCAMLNADVHARYTNHQYQDLNPTTGSYRIHSECSIFFELDGPYHAMVLPASPEEDVLLKKKYVVFNYDQTIAELKGFEIKRRGELELVKIFQSQVFEQFLAGQSLEECYESVGGIANQWLDVLDSKGATMDDDELLELISEKKTISKTLDDYEGRKATSLTTAGRLADFLGSEMIKDKGLNCKLIISKYPVGAPTTERAIPVAIFRTALATRQYFLRKWLKHPSLEAVDFREVVDWDYYKERLGKSIQKIVTIPAGMQRVPNPVPRVEHPAWLQKRLQDQSVGLKQLTLSSMFSKASLPVPKVVQGRHGHLSSPNKAVSPPGRGRKLTSPLRPALANVDTNSITRKRLLFPDMDDVKKLESSPTRVAVIRTPEPIVIQPDQDSIAPASLSPDTNLQAWLKARQNQWKSSRLLKKKNKNGAFRPDLNISKRPVAVTDFVRNAALTTTYGQWQIIEIQQQDSAPGEFILWAMTSPTQLQKIKIVVPRMMYVNCARLEAENAVQSLGGSKVMKELPHGRPCINLYEIAVSEAKYQRSTKSMSLFLSDPGVEGIYETQVPLLMRIILHAGCVAQLSRDAQQYGLGQKHYKLQDLSFVHVNAHSYLDRYRNQGAQFKQIFVYHVVDKGRNSGRGAVAMFIVENNFLEDSPLSAIAYVWLSTGSSNQLIDNRPPFQRLYRRFQPDEAAATVKFSTSYTTSMADALKFCNERLTAHSRERHGPTIVIAQGSTDSRQWRRMLPALQDYPLAALAGNTLDELFPALGWQMFIAERIIQRYLIFPRWFNDRLHCARYSHVPVCNLGVDAITTMIDICYARVLQQGRHLLWASDTRVPDVGGEVADNAELLTGNQLVEISINEPGAYRTVCVELDVYGMAICAIMNSSMLDTQSLTSSANVRTSSSEANVSKAFSLLKALITKWFDDFRSRHDPLSDSMLTALYRYLCGYGDNLLFDPLLYRLVHELMTKLFKRLVGEMRKLGVCVIYADMNRILIDTKKHQVDAAKEYVDFILMAVHNTDMFAYVEITAKDFWEELLWLGPQNYGGIRHEAEKNAIIHPVENQMIDDDFLIDDKFKNADEDVEYDFLDRINQEVQNETEEDNENNDGGSDVDIAVTTETTKKSVNLQSHWTISKFLPAAAQEYFNFVVGEFLLQHYSMWNELSTGSDNDRDMPNKISDTEVTRSVSSYMKKLLTESLTTKMLTMIDDLSHMFHHLTTSDANGTSCSQVALDFIKYTCHVLSLDTSYEDEIASLRRILLAQLRIREFSALSAFVNPCPSYLLKDVICNYCSTCRDLDLLSNLKLKEDGSSSRSARIWQCSHCQNDLDMNEMENRLIEEVQRLTTLFLSQDFRCPKTHQVSIRFSSSFSELAAPLAMDITAESIRAQLETLHLVAEGNGFAWLKATIEELQV